MATKREPLMDQEYFDKKVAYQSSIVQEFEALLAKSDGPNAKQTRLAYSIFLKRFNLLISLYSKGEDLASLKEAVPEVIESLSRYINMSGHEGFNLSNSFDNYLITLWLVSLGLIFKIKDEVFARLVDGTGARGQDGLLERLINTKIPDRAPPPTTTKLLWPKPYELLYNAIDAPKDTGPKLIKEFLKVWYPSMGKLGIYWDGNHKRSDGGFMGYWCIEAAGVATAFRIDDRSFRDLPYYPKDLVSG